MGNALGRLNQHGIAAKIMSMSGSALLGMVILFVVAFTGFSNQKRSIDDLYNERLGNFQESAYLLSECASIHANLYKTLAWAGSGYDASRSRRFRMNN